MHQASAFNPSTAANQSAPIGSPLFAPRARKSVEMKQESLPFTVRLVTSEADVHKAVKVRHSAYARHVPVLAETLREAEDTDFAAGVALLLAESKLDGSPLGTMRIQTNRYRPLALEQSVHLPAFLQHRSLAEATRLGVEQGRMSTFVKTVLFKAFYQYCLQAGIDYMVITARAPLDRQYERLMFSDVFPHGEFVPMRHVGNILHRVLSLDVAGAAQAWKIAGHPMFGFMTGTRHPDIGLGALPVEVDAQMPIRRAGFSHVARSLAVA